MSPGEILVVGVFGVGAGILGALLGTGGGVFLVPLLILVLGVPAHFAVATSIVSVIATSSAVASTNVERGTANMRLGMTLEIATTLGAITGSWLAHLLLPHVLEGAFAVVLLPTALLMWRGARGHSLATSDDENGPQHRADNRPLGHLGARYVDPVEGVVAYRVRRLGWGMTISLLAGMLSGLLGIGGGVFKVPALHLACGVPMKAAAATSNFMIGATAAASAFIYYGRGTIRPVLTAAVVLGVLLGSAVGSVTNRYVHGRLLNRLFAVLLLLVAAQMLVRTFSGG